jgi:hypothetical protein
VWFLLYVIFAVHYFLLCVVFRLCGTCGVSQVWMATDFSEERKWKRAAAFRVGASVVKRAEMQCSANTKRLTVRACCCSSQLVWSVRTTLLSHCFFATLCNFCRLSASAPGVLPRSCLVSPASTGLLSLLQHSQSSVRALWMQHTKLEWPRKK